MDHAQSVVLVAVAAGDDANVAKQVDAFGELVAASSAVVGWLLRHCEK